MKTLSPEKPSAPLSSIFVCIWLVLLIAVSVYIRVHGANDYAYSADESMHTRIASGATLAEVLRFSRFETHPPMLYILCHYWMMISTDLAFVRGLLLVSGVLLIPLYYVIGRELNGPMTGMCCATLVAFSHGCIILSYVVRHYAIFLLFISAAFYCFLLWRKNHGASALAGYVIFGCLAAATHFSAIFDILCISACGLAVLKQRHAGAREWAMWMAASGIVLIFASTLYVLWLPSFPSHSYFDMSSLSPEKRILLMLLYPLEIGYYFFPAPDAALALVIVFAAIALWPGSAARQDKVLQWLLMMMGIALALGMILFITGIYNPIWTRHSSWVYPFVIPVLGWLLSDACTRLAPALGRLGVAYFAASIFACGWAMYSPADRFSDITEYDMTRAQHEQAQRFFATLGAGDLIVMARDDAVMFANTYPYLDNAATNPALMPYGNTHILFNPSSRRISDKKILTDMLAGAQEKHMLDGVHRLIFFHSLWQHAVIADMIPCAAFDKQVVAFPPAEPGHRFTAEEAEQAMAIAFIVPKQEFFDEVLAPSGSAHSCLK